MAKPIKILREKMSEQVQLAARAKAVGIVSEMTLAEAIKSQGINQAAVAKR